MAVVGSISSVYPQEIGRTVGFMHMIGSAVKKEKQGMGIGKSLLEQREGYAKEKGSSSIVLNSGVPHKLFMSITDMIKPHGAFLKEYSQSECVSSVC